MIGDINPTTGEMLNPVEHKEFVYKDTFNGSQEDGNTVDHYSEMDDSPKVSFQDVGKETLNFSYMDTGVDKLVLFLGGTVTTVDGRQTWTKPTGVPNVQKYVKITTLEGVDIEYPRVQFSTKRNFEFRKQGLLLLEVTMTVLSPNLPSGTPLAAVIVKEPAA